MESEMASRGFYRLVLRNSVALLALGAGVGTPAASAQDGGTPERRAAEIVRKMTLEEKASQMLNTSSAIPRLHVAAYQWWSEALHGVIAEAESTNFPQPIGLAATFDTPLLHDVAKVITAEARVASDRRVAGGDRVGMMSGRDLWSPNINIFRDPRWGRGQETYGEDPFLTGRMGVAYITGIQGPDPDHPINVATPKHFAVHSGPEPTRHRTDNFASLHDLRDTYLPAFREAVVTAKAGSVMCAYTGLNGKPACANPFLLQDTLRRDWGFKGYVVSDCEAVADIYQGHKFLPTASAAAGAAVRAGMDNECSNEGFFDPDTFGRPGHYAAAVKEGKLTVAELDRAVTRLVAARIRMGTLADDGPTPTPPSMSFATRENAALALAAAEKSMVLLKNDGILPLAAAKPLRIAVVGPLADARRVLRGNYTSRDTSRLPTVLDGLRAALPNARITSALAGESLTDGDVVPQDVLQTDDGRPGLTMRTFDTANPPGPAPRSLLEKAIGIAGGKFAATPTSTVTIPNLKAEGFSSPILPRGGKIVTTGFLVPEVSGTYRLGLRGSASTLKLDGIEHVSIGLSPAISTTATLKTVRLEAGKRYSIEVTTISAGLMFAELDWQLVSPDPIADLRMAASNADVLVAVVGIDSSLESEEATQKLEGFAGGDRTSLDLPADQRRLLEAAKATGKPLVVVNMSGSAINLDWAKANANAILQAWYPGQEGGIAVGRTIAGLANPAGRLPVTFYRDVGQLPVFDDYRMANRTYRYFTGAPVYPFGYGLSYTRFAYGPVSARPSGRDGGYVVEADLTNTGKRAGDEVAQLYLRFPKVPGAPNIALRGFQRVALRPGERRRLRFELSPRDLSSVSPDGLIAVAPGRYTVVVGGGQPDQGLPFSTASLVLKRRTTLPN
uniref:glycoside hydrolase family 3 C-terminal domain-containing protein n=1 Tax=Sphingomonas sp. PL-96 TaxID=2887201 RepID=UPI001E2EA631|nr:glycoside hydrolase family 3 C-terminal domain-containing protein [Sphingomonas sp. PL-96]